MGTPLTIGDLVRVKVGCYMGNQAAINTGHFRVDALTGAFDTVLLAEEFDDAMEDDYKPLMTNTASYYGVGVQIISPGPLTSIDLATANTGVGTAGTAPLPTQTCGLIACRALHAGRKFRGRLYVPFPDQADMDATTYTPDAGYITTLAGLVSNWYTQQIFTEGANIITLSPVIYHRTTNTYDYVEEGFPRRKWATQRRRGNYGQPNAYPPL